MQKNIRFLISALLLLLLSSMATLAQDLTQKADELVSAYTKQGRFSGAVLVAKDGKVILSKGYGMANYELDVPNTPQMKFRIGSISKQFTAMAIMQLQERGALNVNDAITKHLPDYPRAVGDKVTIHQLLTHTSGIFDYTSADDFEKKMTVGLSLNELIATFKDKPLEFEPGTKFAYCNSGYVLLAAIIEKASGKTYEQFLKESIFQPLGMNNTGEDRSGVVLKNRAVGYDNSEKEITNATFVDMSLCIGAGSLYSTTEDLYLWDRALFTEKLVKKTTLEKIFTPDKQGYSYGWRNDKWLNRKRAWHNGGINGFKTHFSRLADDNICIIVLGNRIPADSDSIGRDLAAVVLGEKYELPEERIAVKVDAKIFDSYVGEYELAPNFIIAVMREGDKLMIQPTGQPKFEVYPMSETKFFLKSVDAKITFVKNEKGEVTSLILHQGREMPAKKIK